MKQRGELTGPDGKPPPVAFEDVVAALSKTSPSISAEDQKKFDAWAREHGSV